MMAAALGAAFASAGAGAGVRAGPARFLVADRDASDVVALDPDLLVVRRIAVERPIEIEARADGGFWSISAPASAALGPHLLRRYSGAGTLVRELAIGVPFDLASLDGDAAITVELTSGATRDVGVYDASGSRVRVAGGERAFCAAGRGGEIAVGGEDGSIEVWPIAPAGAPLAARALGGWIADVAPGPRRGTWWVLDAAGAGRILLLDRGLATLWERPSTVRALHLAPVPATERVWLADATEPFAARFGAAGALELGPLATPARGLDRALGLASGGAILVAPGALIRLGPQGQLLPGQGGFDFAVDAADLAHP
jgi:hypothetical protein